MARKAGIVSIAALLGVGLFMSVAGLAQVGSPSKPVQAVIWITSLNGDSIKVGSPILLGVTLTNTSNDEMVFGKDIYGHGLRIHVRDENGKGVPETTLGRAWNYVAGDGTGKPGPPPDDIPLNVLVAAGKGSMIRCDLKIGQWTDWQINPANLYDLNRPGKYTMQVEMGDPQNTALRLTIKSNKITVTVTP